MQDKKFSNDLSEHRQALLELQKVIKSTETDLQTLTAGASPGTSRNHINDLAQENINSEQLDKHVRNFDRSLKVGKV